MSALSFAQPWAFLLAAVALPVLASLWHLNFQARTRARRRYGEERLLAKSEKPLKPAQEMPVLAVWSVAILLVVLAAADPLLPDSPSTVSGGTMEVVVVIDLSNSMAQEYYRNDMTVPEGGIPAGSYGTSLDMAKQLTVEEIMPAIAGNEIGIVGYSGRGFPQSELTDDFEAVAWVLRHWMKVKNVPGVGSDYAVGLRTAVDIFDRSARDDRERVIVLFSDGGFTGSESDLAEVLNLMRERNIRLVVVAVGSPTPMPIPMYDYQDRFVGDFPGNGQVELVSTDEANLRALAAQEGGQYIRLLSGQDFRIDWARALASDRAVMQFAHVYQYPLAVAALLFAALLLRGLLKTSSRTRQQ